MRNFFILLFFTFIYSISSETLDLRNVCDDFEEVFSEILHYISLIDRIPGPIKSFIVPRRGFRLLQFLNPTQETQGLFQSEHETQLGTDFKATK